MQALYKGLFGVLVSTLILISHPLVAHEGHDEAPAVANTQATPRFSATSDEFELVGVMEANQLKLHLDYAPDNRPVEGATLELQASGSPIPVTAIAPGEFIATWQAPESGEIAFTALINVGNQSDLLVAELDIYHEDEHADSNTEGLSQLISTGLPWLLGGLGLLLGLAGFLNSLRNRPRAEVKA